MKESALEWLACPVCKGSLAITVIESVAGNMHKDVLDYT